MFRVSSLLLLASALTAAGADYIHFEGRQTHPLGLTPGGTRLLALNTPDARLSVFDVTGPAAAPVLIAEIPVGLEPVSLRARTDDEVWVVNEVSDSISVVSLSAGAVIATLPAPDEPADVVFAGSRAYVTGARENVVRVYDTVTRQPVASIPLLGSSPRALAASADGTRVYAAFLLSGNGTTTLTPAEAPAPPAPTNPALPAAPKSALVVSTSDPRVPYTVLDHDVAEISTGPTPAVVRYLDTLGTHLFDLALHPVTGDLWVPHTEARNLVRFEPVLRGHFVDHRLARVTLATGAATFVDLNPGLDYTTLPNPSALATALAGPSALVWENSGSRAWVAAFGSDRIASLDAAGQVLTRTDLRQPGENSRRMRGPRGLVLGSSGARLYVLNKLANSVSVLDTASAALLAEVPAGSLDPMPAAIREGRGFLFDTRLSGNGTTSCATCHLDADRDGLAWDLGNPSGQMLTVIGYNRSIHGFTPQNRVIHPMKGALTTQTLRGFQPGQIFHWRGDKPTLQSFNPTFADLMGGSQIPAADMDALAAYLATLVLHPNPHRNLDRTLPASLNGNSPTTGRDLFNNHAASHCVTCHTLPTGSDNNIDLMAEVGSTQPVKTPHLRTAYQRMGFKRTPGAVNITGYGMLKEGTGGFDQALVGHAYVLENLANLQQYRDVQSFIQCFDTGTAPSVGRCLTATPDTAATFTSSADLATLEAQARLSGASAACDLVVRGRLGGKWRTFFYNRTTQLYHADTAAEPARNRTTLLSLLTPGDALTWMGVPPGQGLRFGGDRDADGTPDYDESVPALSASLVPDAVRLAWPEPGDGWSVETAADPAGPWSPVPAALRHDSGRLLLDTAPAARAGFFRLRRTW